jgi:hypothetical protein
LLRDETFGERFSSMSRTVITVAGDVQVDQRLLFAAVRRALTDRQAVSCMDLENHGIIVKVEQDHLFLESTSRRKKARLDVLMILSPNQEERTQTLRRLLDHVGPTSPDFSALLAKAEEYELKDEEASELFAECIRGVTALQASATVALTTNQEQLLRSSSQTHLRISNTFAARILVTPSLRNTCGPSYHRIARTCYVGTLAKAWISVYRGRCGTT